MTKKTKATEETPIQERIELQYIPITSLIEAPFNPRKRYDKGKMQELTQSVKNQGVLEPILTRPITITPGPGMLGRGIQPNYEILAGSRRFRAAQAAGLKAMPAIVRNVTDGQAIEICVTENLQRDDTHELEEAIGYQELLEIPGYTVATVAIKVGKDESYVYKRLKLLDLVDKAQESFLKGEMTAEHAVMIARLQPDDQRRAFEHLFDNEFGYSDRKERRARTAQSLRRWIDDNILLKVATAKFKTTDENLIAGVPSCPNCPKRTGFNRALFNDIKEKDLCTDPGCFEAKTQAHIAQTIARAEKAGKSLVRVSSSYSNRNWKAGDPLPMAKYQKVDRKDKCESMQPAIITTGDADVGLQITICQNEHCPVHGREINGMSADSQKWQRQRERQERDRRINKESRIQIMDATLKAIENPCLAATQKNRPIRELVLLGAWASLWNESQKAIASKRGWAIVKRATAGIDWDITCRMALAKMEDEIDLDRLLIEITLHKQLDWYPDSGRDRILELATLMNVDHKKITETTRKAILDREKARKKKQKAKDAKKTDQAEPPEEDPEEDHKPATSKKAGGK